MKPCVIEGCGQPQTALQRCRKHYWIARRERLSKAECTVPACGKAQFCGGLCRGHYARKLKGQDTQTLLRPQRDGSATVNVRVSAEMLDLLRQRALEVNLSVERLVAKFVGEGLGVAG